MRVDDAGGALANEIAPTILNYECNEASRGGSGAWAEVGELIDTVGAICDALRSHGTGGAFGLFGRADERAEFHEGLVEVGGRS